MSVHDFQSQAEAARAATEANRASQEAMEQAAAHVRRQQATRRAAEKLGDSLLVVGGLLLATAVGFAVFNKRK